MNYNMGLYSKQVSIFVCGFINIGTFTVAAPFLAGFANAKGVKLWVVGLAYSLEPVSAIISAYFVGLYMEKFGRRFMLTLGSSIVCFNTGLMYLYTVSNTEETIIILYVTGFLSGISYSMYITAAYAILTSEYSECMNRTVALFENCIGLGMNIRSAH